MKIYILAFGLLICMASAGILMKSQTENGETKTLFGSVEALADSESGGIDFQYSCRCHGDGGCYPGSAISFRKQCARLDYNEPSDCAKFSSNCP